jgi:predicted RNA-binding Zn ribbon-like protein
MSTAEAGKKTFILLGGQVCLDFANTVGDHAAENPYENLKSYADLVSWGRQAGLVTERGARLLLREAENRPREASAVWRRAIALREAIYRIFSAIGSGQSPERDDLATLNAELSRAMQRAQVVPTPDGFVWDWSVREEEEALDRVLWPVARSAADLLVSGDLGRVRECADEVCGWLFIDMSKNRSRRWCDMKDCGNQAKSRRHYERKRAARSLNA